MAPLVLAEASSTRFENFPWSYILSIAAQRAAVGLAEQAKGWQLGIN